MKEASTATDLLQRISDSAGSSYLNRAHRRSFSLNVFQMNAVELIGAAQRVKDPSQGMALMMEKNREASLQAHRELNRYVHNFVSSALTLVEHTRVFMRKHYCGTDLLRTYEEQAGATFTNSPVAQFVQGLRNYMLHRGLPNSSMYLNFPTDQAAKDGSGKAETGVRYHTSSLLDWTDWKPAAHTYLEAAGEHLDLHEFAQEYLTLINQFHGWLDAALLSHHQTDLEEFGQLKSQLQAINLPRLAPDEPAEALDSATLEPFKFTTTQTLEIDRISFDILGKVCELDLRKIPSGFPTERPFITLTDRELIGPATGWANEASGEAAFRFIQHEGKSYGLREIEYLALDGLLEVVMKSSWAFAGLSREYIEKVFFDWASQRFFSDGARFSEILSAGAQQSIEKVEVWAPIADTEVEQGFDFGAVRIQSITAAEMARLRSKAPSPRPDQEQQVNQLFDDLREKMQGYAAVIVSIEAEPIMAQKRALQIAQDVVALLRFFSPAASNSSVFSPVALTGAACVPTSSLIVLKRDGFIFSQHTLPNKVGYWRLSTQQLADLKSGLLDAAASLTFPERLNDFSLSMRASLLAYSKGTTLTDPLDRLRSSVYAIEGILLRHEMEPRAHSIANRMSTLLAEDETGREDVKKIVRQVYWLQGQPQLTAQSWRENDLIEIFESHAYNVLCIALANISAFNSKGQFALEIDRTGIFTQ